MAPKPFDAEAAREALAGQLAQTEADAERLDAEVGELALSVVLEEAPGTELEAARRLRADLVLTADELRTAMTAVDAREAAQQEKDAAAKRKADEAEHARLIAKMQAAGAQAAVLIGQLAVVAQEAVDAEGVALAIARRLELTQRAHLQHDLGEMVVAKLDCLRPMPAAVPLPHRGEAEARLVQGVS